MRPHHLYEVTLRESTFLKQSENALGGRIRETYYETKQPLWFHTLGSISCCSRITNADDSFNGTYSVERLQGISKPSTSYLSKLYKYLYLYENTHRQGLGVVALFIGDTLSGSAEAFLWIVGGSIDGISTKQCRMIFNNIVNQLQEEELSEYENILPLLLKSCDRLQRLSDSYESLNYHLNQYN